MAVLVTGGAGYIGSHTTILLLRAGYEVVVVDNFLNSKPESLKRIKQITGKDFKFYEVDLLDKVELSKIFENEKIDSVIHFAGLKAVGQSVEMPLWYYHNNITSTLILCEVMAEHNVKKLVFSSSATVYGNPKSSPIDESFDLSTTNPYGSTKLMIERILSDLYVSDNDWAIAVLRYFNPIGADCSGLIGEDPNGIPNNLMPYIAQVAVGKLECLNIYGNDYDTKDGTGVRDYIHVVDLSDGHLKALKQIEKNKGIDFYNLGTGVGYSVLDVISAFEKASNVKINKRFAPRRAGDIACCFANPTKAKEILGWEATLGIDRMCEDSWRFTKNNPNGL
jgi:UDP-glucose 4-epimerase